ncbi:UNVERIFIED_CONTAM: hypothetical protein Sindi_2490200 [Sesamum indicum]
MAKSKKTKSTAAPAANQAIKPSGQQPAAPAANQAIKPSDQQPGAPTTGKGIATAAQPFAQSPNVTVTTKAAVIAKVGPPDFNEFNSDLEASPSFIIKIDAANTTGPQPKETLPAKDAKTELPA